MDIVSDQVSSNTLVGITFNPCIHVYIHSYECIYLYLYVERWMESVPLLDGWIDICMDMDGWMDGIRYLLDTYWIPLDTLQYVYILYIYIYIYVYTTVRICMDWWTELDAPNSYHEYYYIDILLDAI